MGIDVLGNPATNPNSSDDEREKRGAASYLGDFIKSTLDTGFSAVGTGINAAKGVGEYLYNTARAKSNSVPYSVRLSVSGARNSEDKLKTLRQFYPDAMPTDDGDFTFVDPKTKERVTLNDPGLSVGDTIESIPEIGEMVGGTLGAIGGGAAGGTLLGPPGVIAGGIGGAGVGSAAGQEGSRQFAQLIASLLTGKDEIDTRSLGDMGKDALKTGALNSVFSGIPLAAKAVKNSQIKKYITDESAEMAKRLLGKGYDPTLSQIGSDAGKELNDRLIANKIIGPELQNQEVLKNRINSFLGPGVGGESQNSLANALRSKRKEAISGEKNSAKNLYKDVVFGDDVIDLSNSQKVIKDIYKSRGMVFDRKTKKYIIPNGESSNPDYILDSSMERKMKRIMEGNASEKELVSFRSDVKTALRDRSLKYDTKGTLINLDKSLTDDLVYGSPDITEADRAARAAWFKYKEDQGLTKDLLGRTEGVTEGVGVAQGVTEGQGLQNAKEVFSMSPKGSDTQAAAMSNVLSSPEKRSILGAILQEDDTARGFENSIEKANQRYNMERVGNNLVTPEDRQMFSELLSEAKGTRAIPPGYQDRTGLLNAEASAIGLAGALDPTLGGAAAVGINAARGAPLAAGGTGGTITSALKNNAIMTKINQVRSDIARNAAKGGEIPSNLNYMTSSPATLPTTMAIGQAGLGNLSDGPESNLQIPASTVNQAVPKEALEKIEPQKSDISLDDLLKDDGQPSGINLDNLLGDDPASMVSPKNQENNSPVNPEPRITLDKWIETRKSPAPNMSAPKDRNLSQASERISLEDYMKKRVGNSDGGDSSSLLAQVKESAMRAFPDNPTMQKVAISQAILESGLTGKPSQLAVNNKNLFGIKEGKTAPGRAQSVSYKTQEYRGGNPGNENARFSSNNTYDESLDQYKNLLENLPRYSKVINSTDPSEAFIELQRAGYATDPQYARKLINIYNKSVAPLFTEM